MGKDRVVNLCFHGIGSPRRQLEAGEAHYWITPDTYERVLDEVAGRLDVAISFDDGNLSDVDVALPGLLRRGLSATFFVLAGRLDAPGSLDVQAVRHLRDSGMEIGSHGMDHRSWRGMDRRTSDRELVEARRRLAEIAGAPVDAAALPLGQYDRRLLSRLRQCGYRVVQTSDRRPARRGAWLQPRYSVCCDDSVDTIRSEVLSGPSPVKLLKREAVGVVKRIR